MPAEAAIHPLERAARRRDRLMLAPAVLLLLALFVAPVGRMVWLSVAEGGRVSLANFITIATDEVYALVLWRTFEVAAGTTLLALLLGYPVAYVLSQAGRRTSQLLMIFVVLPYFTSIIVRTYAWMVLLGRNGVVNDWLVWVGIVERPLALMYNQLGVFIGMTYVLLPFMVLTLYSVMRGIDPGLTRAALSLGASRSYAFRRVFLPLTVPGIAGGVLLVFILSLGFFITPALMGGSEDIMIAMLIEREVEVNLNFGFASALATVLLAVTLFAFLAYSRLVRLDRLLASAQ